MDLPDPLNKIERALLASEINAQHAYEKIIAFRRVSGKLWTWSGWKRERDRIIEARCAQCGGTDGPFVLQHLAHPEGVSSILYRLLGEHPAWEGRHQEYRALHAEAAQTETPEDRHCCPKCGGTAVYHSPRLGRWRCNSTTRRRRCGHVFTEPGAAKALTPEQKRRASARKREVFNNTRFSKDEIWNLVGARAVLEYLRQLREYLAFLHTRTFCKRCAFLDDVLGNKPCQTCRRSISTWLTRCPSCETPSDAATT